MSKDKKKAKSKSLELPKPQTDNLGTMVEELVAVLKKYNAHVGNSKLSVKTSNFSLKAETPPVCDEGCILRIHHTCDENGKNCKVTYKCECPPQ